MSKGFLEHRNLNQSLNSPNPSPFSPQNFEVTPKQEARKRIPQGLILGEIPLEAAKAYPIRIWHGTGYAPRIAYADLNTHGEHNTLTVKLLSDGAKTAPHPQIAFFVNGDYHVETLGYARSNAWNWTTWIEFHMDARVLKRLIDAVIRAEIALETGRN